MKSSVPSKSCEEFKTCFDCSHFLLVALLFPNPMKSRVTLEMSRNKDLYFSSFITLMFLLHRWDKFETCKLIISVSLA